MNTKAFQAQQTVEEILKTFPQLMSVFRKHGTDCVGCLLQRFCTLQDVAEIYEVELNALLHDLETCATENNDSQRSIS